MLVSILSYSKTFVKRSLSKIRQIGFEYQLSLNAAQRDILSNSKTCVKRSLSKRPQIGFQDQLLLNAGQTYCRMLQGEHSAIPSTFIRLLFVIKIFVLSVFEWPFHTGFTVHTQLPNVTRSLVVSRVFSFTYTVKPVLSKRSRDNIQNPIHNCLLSTGACLIEVHQGGLMNEVTHTIMI